MWKAAAMAHFKAQPHGYVTVQAISYQLLSTNPEMQSHAYPCGKCKHEVAMGWVLFWVPQFPLVNYHIYPKAIQL